MIAFAYFHTLLCSGAKLPRSGLGAGSPHQRERRGGWDHGRSERRRSVLCCVRSVPSAPGVAGAWVWRL